MMIFIINDGCWYYNIYFMMFTLAYFYNNSPTKALNGWQVLVIDSHGGLKCHEHHDDDSY